MKDSLLWKITHPTQGTEHFLFGTMHVKNEDAYIHVDRVLPLIKACDIYVGEMNLDDPLLASLPVYFKLGSHHTLVDLLGSKKYEKLRKIISKSFQIDLDDYADLKPMIITNIISEKILTATYDLALDHYLWQEAKKMEKPLYGLESAQEQIDILESIPIDTQLKMLKEAVKNVNRFRKKVVRLSQLYSDNRSTELYTTTKKSLGSLRKTLLYTRNHLMADRIVELTQHDTAFITVGAAHLGGKNGILRLLKLSGYKVKPIFSS